MNPDNKDKLSFDMKIVLMFMSSFLLVGIASALEGWVRFPNWSWLAGITAAIVFREIWRL